MKMTNVDIESDLNKQDSFIIDDPVKNREEDELERYPFAQRVARTIASRRDPSSFVVGIYGAWGEGKSTVLNFINDEFDKEYKNSVYCIRFNPWYYRNEDQLLVEFFGLLASKLDGEIIPNRERIGKFLKEYLAKLLPPTTVKLLGIDLGEMFKRWGDKLSEVTLDERKEKIEKILEKEKKKIVIMIDDIDRLDKDEIHTVLKLVKLLANFRHTAYILAFDIEMVSVAIGSKYGGDKESGKAGKGFLEKIVQIPIYLPKVGHDSLEKFCFAEIDQVLQSFDINLNQDEWLRFTENFETGLSVSIQTIRMVKRYVNSVMFALPLIKSEVNIVDFLLLQGINIVYPKLYFDIRDNPLEYLLLSISARRSDPQYGQDKLASLNKKLDELTNCGDVAKQLLACLFPNIRDLLFPENVSFQVAREMSREDKLEIKQRVASEEYFRRFFEYKLPNGDISDLEIDELLKQTITSGTNFTYVVADFVNKGKLDTFLLKIRNRLKELSSETAQKIAVNLSKSGNDSLLAIPQKSIRFLGIPSLPYEFQSVVCELVKVLPNSDHRFNLLKEIINEADLFSFILNFFRYSLQDLTKENLITPDQEHKLGEYLAEKILHSFKEKSIFESGEYVYSLITFLNEFGIQEENHKFFEQEINNDPYNADKLLKCSYSIRTLNNDFNAFTNLVNLKVIRNALHKTYGSDINLNGYESDLSLSDDQKLAYKFLQWYDQEKR